MKAFYTDHFVLPLPSGHRFPMEKYSRLHDLVATVPEIELLEAPSATDTQILCAHDPGYLIKVLQHFRLSKMPHNQRIQVLTMLKLD